MPKIKVFLRSESKIFVLAYLKIVLKYLRQYILSVLFFGYMAFSVVFNAITSIDITIACPIQYTTGLECLGCGLTQATVHLLHFNLMSAWNANPLVFLVLPVLLFLFTRHFFRFAKQELNDRNRRENR